MSGDYVDGGVLTTTRRRLVAAGQPGVQLQVAAVRAERRRIAARRTARRCLQIPGATDSSYTLTSDDVGQYVLSRRAGHLHRRHRGSTRPRTAIPRVSSPVAAAPPSNTGKPSIAGSASQASVLTASPGTWNGTNTPGVPDHVRVPVAALRRDWRGMSADSGRDAVRLHAVGPGRRVAARREGDGIERGWLGDGALRSDGRRRRHHRSSGSNSGGSDSTPAGGSGGSGVHPTTAGGDKTAPTLKFTIVGGGTLVGGTTLQVDATCPKTEKSCKANVKLLATLKKPTGKARRQARHGREHDGHLQERSEEAAEAQALVGSAHRTQEIPQAQGDVDR